MYWAWRLRKYDPDQPRDDRGRWTDSDGNVNADAFDDTMSRDEATTATKSLGAARVRLDWAGDAFKGVEVYTHGDKVLEVSDDGGKTYDRADWVRERAADVVGVLEDKFNREFWDDPGSQPTLYHATQDDNVASIQASGLEPAHIARGLSNRSITSAVFATQNRADIEDGSYGDNIFEINVAQMARDFADEKRELPYVTQEPNVTEREAMGALAHAIGDNGELADHLHEEDSGVFLDTVIFHRGTVPPKYLTLRKR